MRTPAILLGSIVLASSVCAQGDFPFDKATPATFGGILKLTYSGAPANKAMMFMLSLNGGPMPVKLLFGGTDTRSLQVGVDLLPAWLITNTGTGSGAFNLPVPTTASLQGVHIHTQLMTGGAAPPNTIDKISSKIVIVLGAGGTSDLLQSKLGDGRNPVGLGRGMMSVFPIKGKNGSVMLAGGGTGNILGAKGLKTTEIFNFRTMTSGPGPNMTTERALHTATVLKDGRVLMAGGVDAGTSSTSGNPVNTCEIYNPATNTFTATGRMGSKRAGHAATLLNDGRVLVAAGTSELADVLKAINGMMNTCEIYNPTTGTWSNAASIKEKVIGPSLTTLANGKVLVCGGAKVTRGFLNIPVSVDSVTKSQLYTVTSNSWANTGSMKQHRSVHGLNTLLLKDGRVLVTGGVVVKIALLPPPNNFAGATSTNKCEYYNPTTGTWVLLPAMAQPRFSHTANEMGNGRVLVCGGGKGAIDGAVSVTSIQEFNPATNSFTAGVMNLKAARGTHGGAVLPDDTLVVFGGVTSATAPLTLRTMEIVHQ